MVLLLLVGAIVASKKLSELTADVSQKQTAKVVVLDPGHGGEDPGKVGVNEALEKDINLAIAMKVKAYLEEKDIKVIMTREDDNVPEAKMEDLQERVKLINDTGAPLTVCIHQNSYTDPSVWGAQVFYYGHSEEGKEAAQLMQEEFKKMNPDNARETKANDTYYMLKNTKATTIIAECGFLSNPEEAQKLTTEEYQDQVAKAICEGVVKWLDK